MNAAEIVAALTEAALTSSAAIVLVLLLRRPLRMRFGATVAYASWLLVPATLLAVSLPAAIEPATVAVLTAQAGTPLQGMPIDAAARLDWQAPAAWAWLIGGWAAAIGFGVQQRRFRRALGALRTRADGLQQADSSRGLPAALGLLRPRIVVPADFDRRYSAEQQALMRAHERSHIRAGDLHVNAVVSMLRCLLWFNPLLHLAVRHFRHDQELACDQRVIARHPHSRRAYGEAMFKTQLATQALPLGCHWGYGHPLKERIEMLKQPVPSRSRWAVGAVLTASLVLAAGTAAWAAQPARLDTVAVDANAKPLGIRAAGTLQVDGGERRTFAIVNEIGKPFALQVEQDGHLWEVLATAAIRDNGMIDLRTRLLRDDVLVGEPGLTAREGELSVIRSGDGRGSAPEFQLGIVLASGALASLAPPSPPTPPVPPPPPAPEVPPAPPAPPAPAHPAPPPPPSLPPPNYPAAAVAQKISGVVVLVIDIDAQGKPVDIVVERSEPAGVFDQAAVDAAWKWKFTPELEDGMPVASRVRVPVDFGIPPGKGGAASQPAQNWLSGTFR